MRLVGLLLHRGRIAIGRRVVHGLHGREAVEATAAATVADRSSYEGFASSALYRTPAAVSSSSSSSSVSGFLSSANGATGLVLGFDASTGYCTVELSDGRTTKFRPENLASPL